MVRNQRFFLFEARAAAAALCLVILLGFAACAGKPPKPGAPAQASPSSAGAQNAGAQVPPSPPPTLTSAPPTLSPIPPVRLCTPLQGKPLSQMSSLVSNPFHPPAPGKDDPHAGVDLAVTLPDTDIAVAGHPVQAALPGKVVTMIHDRFPFGIAFLIETPLDAFPADWWQPAQIPSPAPTLAPRSALTCPAAPAPVFPDPNRRSLYTLYAHLQKPAQLKAGEAVACGQVIGEVGQTGNALAPHLHFETRVGPSGLQMTSMGHYFNSVTQEEMSNYCLWTVSGLFQVVDPLKVLGLKQ